MKWTISFLFLCSFSTVLSGVVRTPQGNFHGLTSPDDGFGTVEKYLGIPFAKAPVGNLRLKPPASPPGFGDYNATSYHASCPQPYEATMNKNPNYNISFSEDCLYLNVYKPEVSFGPDAGRKLPVMVWIHGGGFTYGAGAFQDGTRLAAIGKVIVVTINYRLGILGFYPNGKTESTLGLQDQIMALRWVNMSISYFGGDPGRVTIFGESAGGGSVSLLSSSPRARGLFQRAIAQSGVALSPFTRTPGNAERKMWAIREAVKAMNCHTDPLDCIKSFTVEQLISYQLMMFYSPEVDNEYVMSNYADPSLVHPGLEIVMGLTSMDGAEIIYMLCTAMGTKVCDVSKGVDFSVLKSVHDLAPIGLSDDQVEHLAKQYNAWYPYSASSKQLNVLAGSMLGHDTTYRLPINRTATDLSKAGFKVYLYEFNISSINQSHNQFPSVPWTSEALHTFELPFVFAQEKNIAADVEISKKVIKLWTDFAKGEMSGAWPEFSLPHAEYLYMDRQSPSGRVRSPFMPRVRDSYWKIWFNYGVIPEFGDEQISGGERILFTWLNIILAICCFYLY